MTLRSLCHVHTDDALTWLLQTDSARTPGIPTTPSSIGVFELPTTATEAFRIWVYCSTECKKKATDECIWIQLHLPPLPLVPLLPLPPYRLVLSRAVSCLMVHV